MEESISMNGNGNGGGNGESNGDSTCTFVLSNRFVQGVLEVCTKHSSSRSNIAKSTKEQSQKKTDSNNGEDESSDIDFEKHLDESISMLPPPKENGYCDLAFVVFVLSPLMCCKEVKSQSDTGCGDMHSVRQFLEGYTITSTDLPSAPVESSNATDAAGIAPPDIDSLNLEDSNGEGKNDTTGTGTCTHGDSDEDPLKEVFAAEEDDDDFDFHSDRFANETTLQPAQATPLRNDFTINEVALRIKHLLNELSYARLSSMSETSWKQWNVSNVLIELILILQSFASDDGKQHCNEIESLSTQFNKPLFVLRDRALDERYNHDALGDYLNLVETLLHIDTTNNDSYKIRLSRAVSLSILAGLCSSKDVLGVQKKSEKAKIRATIIKSLDVFVTCIEYVRAKKSTTVHTHIAENMESSNQGQGWMHVVMNIVPILDFLTSIKSQTTCKPLDDSPIHQLSKDEGYAMLQFGFFRELILLFTGSLKLSGSQSGDALYEKDFCRDQLLRSTLILSAQCPSHLGKYATRVPELKNVLYSDSFASNNEDAILWYALLSHLNSSSNLQMRMKGNISLTKGELQERCFEQTSKLLNELLSFIRNYTQNTSIENEADNNCLHIFGRIVNLFVSVPFLSECWVTVISSTADWKNDTKRLVSTILKELNAVPVPVTAKCYDESKKTDKAIDKSKHNDVPVAALRKGCKLLLLSLESDLMKGTSTLPMMSSKTD
jgi:hypothetical protein